MSSIDKIAGELVDIIKSARKKDTEAYDTAAEVKRIEGDTAWVHIPGGVDETPVKLTISAKEGDTVQVRVSGGNAWIAGNTSAPPTDDGTAILASETANEAKTTAQVAGATAEEAKAIAEEALKNAGGDTPQYFWHEETGSDPGAHITPVPQDDFKKNQTGGNTIIRSGGVAIRDGLTDLAKFSSEGVQVGADNESHTTMTKEAFRQYGQDGSVRLEVGDTDTGTYVTEDPYKSFTSKGTYVLAKAPLAKTLIYIVMDTYVAANWKLERLYVALTGGTSGSGQNVEFDGKKTLTITPLSSSYPTIIRSVTYAVEGVGPVYSFGPRREYSSYKKGERSFCAGEGNTAQGPNAAAFGKGTDAIWPNSFVIGAHPWPDEGGRYVFLVGNGDGVGKESNALGLDWNGNLELGGYLTDESLLSATTISKWRTILRV